MAITNYSTLRTAVAGSADASWTHRTDITQNFDTFLALMQEDMYRGPIDEGLRVRDMEVRYAASLSTSSRFLALPDNYLEIRRLELEYSNQVYPLRWVPASALQENAVGSRRPRRYTITSQFEFDSTPDVAYTIEAQYYQTLTDLSSSSTTHAILTRFPSIFLNGCLFRAFQWARDQEMALTYNQLFQDSIKQANAQDRWGRIGPSPSMVNLESIA